MKGSEHREIPDAAKGRRLIVGAAGWGHTALAMKSEMFQRLKAVPPIVRIIISQATRRRAARRVTEDYFAAQMDRLAAEELEPRGLTLLMRELPGGRCRFIVKVKATGATCDMLDFASDGTPETDTTPL